MTAPLIYFLDSRLPRLGTGFWPQELGARAYQAVVVHQTQTNNGTKLSDQLGHLFRGSIDFNSLSKNSKVLVRAFRPGVSHPMAQSLGSLIGVHESDIRVDEIIVFTAPVHNLSPSIKSHLEWTWKEPAIEEIIEEDLASWLDRNSRKVQMKPRTDDSFSTPKPEDIDLEFTEAERFVMLDEEKRLGRHFTRAELELLAQTWSEHCKHKIFAAKIESQDTLLPVTDSLFKTHIRRPTFEIDARDNKKRLLSVFHDNAGVLALETSKGADTAWAIALKMETHNSPSAISPYGGASTGIVGVHRDILGTGQGAQPIANWDVLCFESSSHLQKRPEKSLAPDVLRLGVIKGIEDGGNQSGIPTVQGSCVFDPRFAVKPYVFAGTVGLLPKERVAKKPQPGLKLYCFGGAVGADGLRGAVMSSRDLRSSDFSGSAVQVASAFVQRRMTDFLMEAREKNLLDVITDNGAGGLASSVGEMAGLTGGARIDLTHLRLKFAGLLPWERLLSESQERMTVATASPEKLEVLAREWDIPFDRLGELNDSGRFEVFFDQRSLVNLSLKFLHEGCPQLHLKTHWTRNQETEYLEKERQSQPIFDKELRLFEDFATLLNSEHLCSRQGIVRRFDHEVQGRTLRKPFQGISEESPADGSLIEIPEVHDGAASAAVVLTHALAPWRHSIEENVVFSFDEALRTAVIGGMRLETCGALDNFCWPDPIPSENNPRGERHLWRLVRANEILSQLCREFRIPLISGKDSMKNNSRDFEAPATLVLSIAGSSYASENIPVSFFARANEVVFWIPPMRPTMLDSIWERVLGRWRYSEQTPSLFGGNDRPEAVQNKLSQLTAELLLRYGFVSQQVSQGMIRAAKDIGEGGLLTSVFELCLGRQLGFQFEASPDPFMLFSEGLGGFVLSVDPHHAQHVEAALPMAKRLGVVLRTPLIRFAEGTELDVLKLRQSYVAKSQEGFFG